MLYFLTAPLLTRCHIPEDLNLQHHSCEKLTCVLFDDVTRDRTSGLVSCTETTIFSLFVVVLFLLVH
jgi:hypothetical protein